MDLWMDVDAALSEVPVNLMPLIDDTDFKTREESVVYNQAGLDLVWNFVTCAGAFTQTAVTPTDTAGLHDWVNQGNGMYSIEIPASGGTINNDTEGFGWFSGFATGILPWRGPVIGFRAAGLNNLLIESASSATRGLSGTALPDAVADAAGGLPIKSSIATAAEIQAELEEDGDSLLDTIRDAIENGTYGLSALKTLIDAIPTVAEIQTEMEEDGASLLDTIRDDLANGTDGLGALKALIDALNDISAADVNTQVADVLKTDTLGEPAQGAPPATASIEAKIAWLYKFLRNKSTDDGSNVEVFNDAGAVVDHKAPVSEAAGTVTRGKFVSGP